MIFVVATGCLGPIAADPDVASTWAAADLWDDPSGTQTVGDVVVSSPRTLDGRAFYAQDPVGGPASGIRVVLAGVFADLPPPIGTPVVLTGPITLGADGPEVFLRKPEDLEIVGPPEAIDPVLWTDDPDLAQSLVVVDGVTITSDTDPAGHADTDAGVAVASRFVQAPGFGRSGTLSGILIGGRIHPRDPGDFDGGWIADPPQSVPLSSLDAVPDGTPVRLHDLVQATSWDRAGRWAVLQDPDGAGLWIDAEGWGIDSTLGVQGSWTGEIRHDGDGVRLRAWTPPTDVSTGGPPRFSSKATDGALIVGIYHPTAAPDALGEVDTSEGPRLDDRFVDLGDLPGRIEVDVAVRGGDEAHHAVLERSW